MEDLLLQLNDLSISNKSKAIDKLLIVDDHDKTKNAEVSTPHRLRKEMLDKIPADFWTTTNTVFEPCAGKGGFIVDIIDRFMVGLTDEIPDEKKRYKTIVEQCLYFSDINPTNIFVCKLLVDPYNEYKLNYNEGDTLKLDIKQKWGIDGFDAVIGNPPYNSSGNNATGNTIWQHFTKISLNEWIKPNGYLVFVHPSGWRKPCYNKSQLKGLFKLMTKDNQMLYLSIHNVKDGMKTFNCGTCYDWYVIEKKPQYKSSLINDENREAHNISLDLLEWLPNYNINIIQGLLIGNDKCDIIMNSSYHATRKYVSYCKTDEFKYPLVHSTPKAGVRYMYSKFNDKGHFGISKVIFGDSGIYNALIDMAGNYGMTQHAMAIKVDTLEEAKNIKLAIESDKFKDLLKSCLWSNFQIDWRMFKYFKKDFWKEFI